MSRTKGRDIYDIIFLNSLGVAPDITTIQEKYPAITTEAELYDRLLERLEEIDLNDKKRGVEHLLINPQESALVELLPQLLEQKRAAVR